MDSKTAESAQHAATVERLQQVIEGFQLQSQQAVRTRAGCWLHARTQGLIRDDPWRGSYVYTRLYMMNG